MADQVSAPIEESDAIQDFLHACDEADLEEAERLARSKKIPRAHIRHGLKMFLTTHETYDGLDTLFAESGFATSAGFATPAGVDQGFVSDVIHQTNGQENQAKAIKLFNKLDAPYSASDFIEVLFHGSDAACIDMIRSGNLDVQQNNSIALLYAATSQRQDVFNELMKSGSNPRDTLSQGPQDARYADGYKTLTKWTEEYYKAETNALRGISTEKVDSLYSPATPTQSRPVTAMQGNQQGTPQQGLTPNRPSPKMTV